MTEGVLLDTHAAIWISDGGQLHSGAEKVLSDAAAKGRIHISPITSWEVATLVSKRRIALAVPVETWFDRLTSLEGALLAEMPPKVLIASASLPGSPPKDPADRILAATAREYGLTLVTRDRQLLIYADNGHVRAIAC